MLTKIIRDNKKLRIISLVAAIIVMTVIFVLSAQNGSDSDNVSITFTSLFLGGDLDFAAILNVLVREIAHAVEYAALGAPVYLFASTFPGKEKVKCILSFLFSSLYSVSDEIHQYFVPGRACQLDDVVVDSLGALLSIFVFYLILKALKKRDRERFIREQNEKAGERVINSFSAYIRNEKYEFVPEDMTEFKAFTDCAFKQKLMPMTVNGVRCDKIPEEAFTQLKMTAIRQVVSQSRRTDAFLNVYRKITEQGIIPLCVKGIVCRSLYPEPDSRSSGDEDLLVSADDFEKCASLLDSLGFCRDKNDAADFEIGFTNPDNGVRIELHKSLFSDREDFYNDFNSVLGNLFENKIQIDINGTVIYAPDWDRHFLYILLHSFKHFIQSGVGIRQICDLAIMAQKQKTDLNYIASVCENLGIFAYFNAVLAICCKYFGLDSTEVKKQVPLFDEKTDVEPMVNDMLCGGIYGSESKDRLHTSRMTEKSFSTSGGNNSLLLNSAFPPVRVLKERYKFLENKPWLLPAAWVMRIFAYLNSEHDFSKTVKTGKQRLEMMKKYNIIPNNKK